MKTFKAIFAASVIAFSLSIPAYADPPPPPGDIHVPGRPDPIVPPPPIQPGVGVPIVVDDDVDLTALADLLWTLFSIF